ncbi:hypothetical protein [Bradyrhizobium yuanmingense]|uniref:hypothetical protein n=1 Tax=Bradyrhizobium yuanmingense TaxID=108015 RepID=UPI003513BF1C
MHGPGSASDGFLHSDDAFGTLMRLFPGRVQGGHAADIRKELDRIRELILTDERRRAQQPSRAQIHVALDEIARPIRQFLDCAQKVDFDWLANYPPTEPAGPLSIAYSFPSRLRALADSARQVGQAELLMLADAADGLAAELTMLNEPAQSMIFRQLSNAWDYEVRQFSDAVRIAQQLELAARTALQTAKKSGGPLPRPMLLYAVISLGDLVERCRGTFTHNPYLGLEYKGEVNTPAGHFVLHFLQGCLPITEQTVCSLMAAAIKRRNRIRDRKSEVRYTSF